MTTRLAYHPSARVDTGGRNTKGRVLRKEHLQAQAAIAARVLEDAADRQRRYAEAQANAAIDAKVRELRSLMGAPMGR